MAENSSSSSDHEAKSAQSELTEQQSFLALWHRMAREGELHTEQARQFVAASRQVSKEERAITESVIKANEALSKWGIALGLLSLTTVGMSRVGVWMQGNSTSNPASSAGSDNGAREITVKHDHSVAGTTLFGDPICQVDFAHEATGDEIVEAVKVALDQARRRSEGVIEVQRS